MRRRLRKKLRVGEFREYGFEVSFRLADSLPDASLDRFWDSFIADAIEARGLMCGGGCGRVWDVFVTCVGRRSTTEDDRRDIIAWLQRHPDVFDVRIGPLIDAWHSSPPEKAPLCAKMDETVRTREINVEGETG